MKNQKNDLVLSALSLVRVGEALEGAKGQLRKLAEQGVSYDSEEMKRALDECLLLQQQWKELELDHLKLKNRISRSYIRGQIADPIVLFLQHTKQDRGQQHRPQNAYRPAQACAGRFAWRTFYSPFFFLWPVRAQKLV